MGLPMTDSEIAANYRQAKNPTEQICILADLNCTSRKEIIASLEREGVSLNLKETRNAKMQELYDEGLNDKQIAEEMEISATTVANWRKNNGLICNKFKHKSACLATLPTDTDETPEEISEAAVLPMAVLATNIEVILSTVKPDAGNGVKAAAAELAVRMMDEYACRRLGIEQDATE